MLTTSSTRRPVLVVDDDAEFRESLALMLHQRGYPVRTALNGEDALTALGEMERPGLILLDLTMPVMDGNSFLTELNQHSGLATIPVFVIAAVPRRTSRTTAGIFRKPVDFDSLLSVVRQHCEHDSRHTA